MHCVRWGIIGCGDVTEVKSGPGFQKADGSALVAVMRRDGARARDYARRHGVPRAYDRADHLIADQEVDAVYIATPPSSHRDLAIRVAEAGKPCLVEKPMAATHAECHRRWPTYSASAASPCGWRTTAGRCHDFCASATCCRAAPSAGHVGACRGDRAADDWRSHLARGSRDCRWRPVLRPWLALR